MNREVSKWVFVLATAALLLGCSREGDKETDGGDSRPHVTSVDESSMPEFVQFRIDQPLASCEADSALHYVPSGNDEAERAANARAALKLLRTALEENLTVKLEAQDAAAGRDFCEVSAVELRR